MQGSKEACKPKKSSKQAPPSPPDGRRAERKEHFVYEREDVSRLEMLHVAKLANSNARAGYQCTPSYDH